MVVTPDKHLHFTVNDDDNLEAYIEISNIASQQIVFKVNCYKTKIWYVLHSLKHMCFCEIMLQKEYEICIGLNNHGTFQIKLHSFPMFALWK